MAEYQNIFTRVQVARAGVPGRAAAAAAACARGSGTPASVHLLGPLGDAQIGPIYLGWPGVASLHLRLHRDRDHRPQHAGLGQLGPDPVRAPAALARARAAAAAVRPAAAAAERGRLVADGRLLPDRRRSCCGGCACTAARARSGMGTHVAWAFAVGDLAVPGARLHPPAADGQLGRGGAVRHLPAPRLDGGVLDPLRQPVLQPVPHAVDRLPVRLDAAVRDARRDHPRGQPLRRRARDRADRRPRHGVASARRCSGAGRWASTPRWNRSTAGPGGSRCCAR